MRSPAAGRRLQMLAIAVILAVLFYLLFSGFGDVPCQDGIWDPASNTCVPT